MRYLFVVFVLLCSIFMGSLTFANSQQPTQISQARLFSFSSMEQKVAGNDDRKSISYKKPKAKKEKFKRVKAKKQKRQKIKRVKAKKQKRQKVKRVKAKKIKHHNAESCMPYLNQALKPIRGPNVVSQRPALPALQEVFALSRQIHDTRAPTQTTPVQPQRVQTTPVQPQRVQSTPAQPQRVQTTPAQPQQNQLRVTSVPNTPSGLVIPQNVDGTILRTNFVKSREYDPLAAKDIYFADLGFGGKKARTDQYSDVFLGKLPTIPFFHPYHPGLNLPANAIPRSLLNISFPQVSKSLISPEVEGILQKAGVPLRNIESYVSVQEMPWQGVSLLLRPQGWLSPNEPALRPAYYLKSFDTKVVVLPKRVGGPTLQHQPADNFLDARGLLSIHNTRNRQSVVVGPRLISSGNTLPLERMDLSRSEVLYSIVVHDQRAAVTKHILLNQNDEGQFEEVMQNARNINDVKTELTRRRTNLSQAFADEFNF